MTIRTQTSKLLALAAATAILAASLSTPAGAQENKVGAQWIKYRQGAYTVLGTQIGMMGPMASGKAPFDAKAFQVAAERAAFMATIVPDLFPDVSKSGAPTKAKAAIWENKAEFDQLKKDLGEKTAALAVAAKSGNLETIKPAFGAAAQTCKACHDKYKED